MSRMTKEELESVVSQIEQEVSRKLAEAVKEHYEHEDDE